MRFLLVSLVLFAFAPAFAQRNYVPAVITTLKNDSLRGFIDYRNWNISPSEIHFKESLSDDKVKNFGPGEIKGFRIAQPDEMYVSRKVKLDITNQELNLNVSTVRVFQDTLIFIRLVQDGVYSLYVYTDMYSRGHFIYEKDEITKELEYVKTYVFNDSFEGIYTSKLYQKQLELLFNDCPAVAKRGARAEYREASLINLFIAYNNCKNPASLKTAKKVKSGLVFGIMSGISFNSFKLDGMGQLFRESNYKSSESLVAGIFLDIPFSHNRRQFSLMNELLYKSVKTEGTARNAHFAAFEFSYLQVSTLFRYTYPKGQVKPYANLGMGNSFAISTKQNVATYRAQDAPVVAIDGPRTYEQSLILGVGAQLSHFNAELRYAVSNGFSPYSSNSSTVKSVQILAGYRF